MSTLILATDQPALELSMAYESLNTRLTSLKNNIVAELGTDYLVEIECLRQQANSLNLISIEELTKAMTTINTLIIAISSEQKSEENITMALEAIKKQSKVNQSSVLGTGLK
jgi:hypothetical protein